MISAILAVAENGVIGNEDKLPWPHIKEDMIWFMNKTKNNVVVMGSKTWDSLGIIKPLKDRLNYVVSSQPKTHFEGAEGVLNGQLCSSLRSLEEQYPDKEIFVIGGANIYAQAFPYCDNIYLSRIKGEYEGDTKLSVDIDYTLCDYNMTLRDERKVEKCTFQTWSNI